MVYTYWYGTRGRSVARGVYHIYNRGVEKRPIFLDDEDRHRFVRLLYLANSTKSFVYRDVQEKRLSDIDREDIIVAIGVWVLMPNHFHLLIKEVRPHGISTYMEKLLTAYSAYFNKRYGRVGPLFQGRFAARHADSDEYLQYLIAYIYLNPVKLIEPHWKETGITNIELAEKFVEDYPWSSYKSHLELADETGLILSPEEFPEYFLNENDFTSYVSDWLRYKDT